MRAATDAACYDDARHHQHTPYYACRLPPARTLLLPPPYEQRVTCMMVLHGADKMMAGTAMHRYVEGANTYIQKAASKDNDRQNNVRRDGYKVNQKIHKQKAGRPVKAGTEVQYNRAPTPSVVKVVPGTAVPVW